LGDWGTQFGILIAGILESDGNQKPSESEGKRFIDVNKKD